MDITTVTTITVVTITVVTIAIFIAIAIYQTKTRWPLKIWTALIVDPLNMSNTRKIWTQIFGQEIFLPFQYLDMCPSFWLVYQPLVTTP